MNQKHSEKRLFPAANCHGFTLVEIMVALAIAMFITLAIYSVYASQQRIYSAQNQVSEMQQNIRAALDMLNREVLMAGYDAAGDTFDVSCSLLGAGGATAPGILSLSPTKLDFSMDLNGDGDCADQGENLTYDRYYAVDKIWKLGRRDNNDTPPPKRQAVAENFDAIEFVYLDATNTPTATLSDVQTVQISLLARARRPDRDFFNNMTYTPASGTTWDLNGAAAGNAPNDNLRRRLLITTVNSRNLGI